MKTQRPPENSIMQSAPDNYYWLYNWWRYNGSSPDGQLYLYKSEQERSLALTHKGERPIYKYVLEPEAELPDYRPFLSNTGQLAWLTRPQKDRFYLFVVSPEGRLLTSVCLFAGAETLPAPSVRLLEVPDHCFHWVDFFTDSHFWLLLPTGQRIVIDLTSAQLLSAVSEELHIRLLEAEKEWALTKLERIPSGVCLNQHEEAALILNIRNGWNSEITWLPARIEEARNAPGGSHLLNIPGKFSVTNKGAALLKLFHYAHGGPPSDVTSYHFYPEEDEALLPKLAPYPDSLQPEMTPRAVLHQMGCPDWIDLGRKNIWDYYHPLGDGLVARTTVEWGPGDQMQGLHREQMSGKQIAERANHHLASGGLRGPCNPPQILEMRGSNL